MEKIVKYPQAWNWRFYKLIVKIEELKKIFHEKVTKWLSASQKQNMAKVKPVKLTTSLVNYNASSVI